LVRSDDPGRAQPKPIGIADSGPAKPVLLSVSGGRHHMHVIGHTGGGKSTELLNMIVADARAGRGVAVFDPKGDLVNDVLGRLPARCDRRLVVIDPAETQAPPSLNILDAAGPGLTRPAPANAESGLSRQFPSPTRPSWTHSRPGLITIIGQSSSSSGSPASGISTILVIKLR
jgi:Type IV secretion-system coupling protein DNA-binding domain